MYLQLANRYTGEVGVFQLIPLYYGGENHECYMLKIFFIHENNISVRVF